MGTGRQMGTGMKCSHGTNGDGDYFNHHGAK